MSRYLPESKPDDVAKMRRILQSSPDEGLTIQQLCARGRKRGVNLPVTATKLLVEQGLAKVERHSQGRPTRVKATQQA